MYRLSKHQAATAGMLHNVAKFYMNIMPLRPTEIHNFQFHRIGNGTLANTPTAKV
jgi:hypothetical protein